MLLLGGSMRLFVILTSCMMLYGCGSLGTITCGIQDGKLVCGLPTSGQDPLAHGAEDEKPVTAVQQSLQRFEETAS